MNKLLVALGALMAGALLIPDVAEAQRGGRGGGGGARVGGGSAAAAAASGGAEELPGWRLRWRLQDVYSARRRGRCQGRNGEPRLPRCGDCRATGPCGGTGGFRQAAIANPGGRFDNRYGNRGDWRYGYGATGGRYPYYGGRYPYYGGRYPYYGNYYGGWGAGLAAGAVIGAAATYPYYNYPYSTTPTPTPRTRHRSRQRTAAIARPRSAPVR